MSIERPSDLESIYAAAELVSAQYGNDTYQYTGPINSMGFARIVSAVLEERQRPNCLLILTTNGGDLDVAYQLTRFLHSKYSKLIVCVPGLCRSAGALVALGAHEILADEFSDFGPIAGRKYTLGESVDGGLAEWAAFEFGVDCSLDLFEKILARIKRSSASKIQWDVAAELSLAAAHSLMLPCLSRINLGEAGKERSKLSVAIAYGNRLAAHAQNTREGAVERMVEGYPSHDFIIDYVEAQSLFSFVEKPKNVLYQLLDCLDDFVYTQRQVALVRRLQRPGSRSDKDAPGTGVSPLRARAADGAPVRMVTNGIERHRSLQKGAVAKKKTQREHDS